MPTWENLTDELKKIKLLAVDVDGVLTDATLFYIEGQGWVRRFNVYDGFGLKLLLKNGIDVAVVSAAQSEGIRERMKTLGIEKVYLGNEDKTIAIRDLKEKTGVDFSEMAYVGDELFDIPVIEMVGLGISVPNGVEQAKSAAQIVTTKRGGNGAVREICEAILKVRKDAPAV